MKLFSTISLLAILAWSTCVQATTYQLTPNDNWFATLNGDHLKPGDEVILGPGEYRDGRRLVISHRGTAERPIVIRSSNAGQAVLHRPDARQNSINLVGAQYLILQGIEITGGSTGIRLQKSDRYPCKFVTLEGLHIHHVGGPAITANNEGNAYEGLIFRHNHIHHTSGHGEGFYLGVNNKSDGSTHGYIFNCLIEGNYIHDLKGPDVSQGDGIEIKDGSYNNIVRDNVIHDTNYPGILVYGTDGKAPNVVERNVIWNAGDHGIQAAAEAVIRNNIIFDSRGDGIRSQPHQSAKVGNLQILHNTVISDGPGNAAVRISIPSQQELVGPLLIANNALYAKQNGFTLRLPHYESSSRPTITLAGNIGSGRTEGLPPNANPTTWNSAGQIAKDLDEHYFPRRNSLLIGAANRCFHVTDDFNATPRHATHDAGAYRYNSRGNPGWTISPDFKKLQSNSPPSRK